MKKILIISQPASGKTTATKKLNKNIAIRTERPALDLDLRGRNLKVNQVFRDSMTNLINEAFNQGATFVFTHCGYVQPTLLNKDITVYYVVQTDDKMNEAVRDSFIRDAKNEYCDKPYFSLDYKKNKFLWRNNQINEAVFCKYLHNDTKIIMLPLHVYISDLINFSALDLNCLADALTAEIKLIGYGVDAFINACNHERPECEKYLDKIHRVNIQENLNKLLDFQFYSIIELGIFTSMALESYVKTNKLKEFMKPLHKSEVNRLRKIVSSSISGCDDDVIQPLKDR